MSKLIDLTGVKCGRVVVTSGRKYKKTKTGKNKKLCCLCKCDCGKNKWIS